MSPVANETRFSKAERLARGGHPARLAAEAGSCSAIDANWLSHRPSKNKELLPESTLAVTEVTKHSQEVNPPKLRPEHIDEAVLAVGRLPKQEPG